MKKEKELTVQQTALRLGVTLKYVRDLLYEQKLVGARKEGHVWRIPTSAVEQWKQARQEDANELAGLQR
jgi:excisionase family DNA binding protein